MVPFKFGFDKWNETDEPNAIETTEPEIINDLNSIRSDDSVNILLPESNESSQDSTIGENYVSESGQMKKVFVYTFTSLSKIEIVVFFLLIL